MNETKYACLPRSSWVMVLAAIHATAGLAQDLELEEIGFDLAVQVGLEDEWRRVEECHAHVKRKRKYGPYGRQPYASGGTG